MEPIEATNRAGQSTAVGRPKPVPIGRPGPQQRLGLFAVRLRNRLYLRSNAFLFGSNHPANLGKIKSRRADSATAYQLITSVRLAIAEYCTGLQFPHRQRVFLFPALPTIAEHCVRVRVKPGSNGLRSSWIIRRRFLCR